MPARLEMSGGGQRTTCSRRHQSRQPDRQQDMHKRLRPVAPPGHLRRLTRRTCSTESCRPSLPREARLKWRHTRCHSSPPGAMSSRGRSVRQTTEGRAVEDLRPAPDRCAPDCRETSAKGKLAPAGSPSTPTFPQMGTRRFRLREAPQAMSGRTRPPGQADRSGRCVARATCRVPRPRALSSGIQSSPFHLPPCAGRFARAGRLTEPKPKGRGQPGRKQPPWRFFVL